MNKYWLNWIKELQSIAQAGLTYSKDKYDIDRFQQIQKLAAEIASRYSAHSFEEIESLFKQEDGYSTPKVDVRGVVFRENKILLVREIIDGKWTLPGGWADVNLSASQNVMKEIEEESGFQTRCVKLLAVYDRNLHGHPPIVWHVYKLFFLCEITGGEARHSIETDGVGFFDLDNLPELSIQRVTEKQLKRMAELRHLNTVDFD